MARVTLGAAILIPFATATIGQQAENEKFQDVTPRLGFLPPWFKDFDTDGDGKISLDEWREGGRDPLDFRKFDLNGDGFITAEEVLRVLKKPIPKGLPPWFKELDTDGNGEITLHQWLEGGRDLAEFRKYDLNGDGFVTAEEVISYLKKRLDLKLTNGQGHYNGIIEPGDEEKYRGKKCFKVFNINFDQGKTYQIDHISNAFDSYLYLEDPNGTLLAENDDGGEGVNARLIYRAAKTGTYRVIATSLGSSLPGPFQFSVRVVNRFGHVLPKGLPWWFNDLDTDGDDQISLQEWLEGGKDPVEFNKYDLNGDGFITTDELIDYFSRPVELTFTNGELTYNGTIEETPDELYRGKKSYKRFIIKLEKGKTYQFDQISAAYQSHISLEDAEGNLVSEISAPNVGQNCRLIYRAEKSGNYRLIATSAGGFRTGDFVLTVHYGHSVAKGLPGWFRTLDKDGDGQISLEKWRKAGKDVNEFRKYDLNSDGLITADEVLAHIKRPSELTLNNGQASYNSTIEESEEEQYRGRKSFQAFNIKLEEETTYQFDCISPAFQAFLSLEDPVGNLLAETVSPNVGENCRMVFHAQYSGTYRLVVTSANGVAKGEYSLTVNLGHVEKKRPPKWFRALDKKGEGQISLDQWLKAGKSLEDFNRIDRNGDGYITVEEAMTHLKRPTDLTLRNGQANYTGPMEQSPDEMYRGKKSFKIFALRFEQGKTYQIDHTSSAFHAFLSLEDGEGNLLAEAVSPNVGENCRIIFRAEKGGMYRIIATSSAGVRVGQFSLSIRYGYILPEGLPKWFTGLDKDGDGQISLEEWREGGKDREEFLKYDLNGDGYITLDELQRYLKHPFARTLPKGLPSWFKELDKKHEGQISLEQWRAAGKDVAEFHNIDLNDDGLVTAEEVLLALKRSLDLTLVDGRATYKGTIEATPEEPYRGKVSYKSLSLKLEQGKTYQIEHQSAAFQAYVHLEDSEGNQLAEHSSPDVGGMCRLSFTAPKSGVFRLVATSAAGVRVGDFVLTVRLGQTLTKGLPPWFLTLDKDGDGQISLDEWREAGKEPGEFRKYDLNGDGLITADEMLRYLRKPLPPGFPSWFKELDPDGEGHVNIQKWHESGRPIGEFLKYDLNRDFRITVDEMIAYMKKPPPKGGLPSWFKELDVNGNGLVFLQQWIESGREQSEFRKYDLNGDGILTEDEVIRAVGK
jgi:Ca2+-binding EF-hand superfamily protein